jgi:hypothetical protein
MADAESSIHLYYWCSVVTFAYLVPEWSYMPFNYGGNDVRAISGARWRLEDYKMADSESLAPLY